MENKTAKELDAERLAKKRRKKTTKKKHKSKNRRVKKNVLETIPYERLMPEDIFYLGKNAYSKAYTFDDINFNLSDEEQQYTFLDRYIEFMNILDDTVDCQITLLNSRLNIEDFRSRVLMKERADDFFDLRFEFNDRVLEENIKKGQNAVSKQMYITLTIHSADDENAVKKFRSLDITLTNAFTRIGTTNIRAMSNAERLELLKTYFVGDEARTVPELDEKSLKRREDRLYICPDYFEFKKDYFMFDNTYHTAEMDLNHLGHRNEFCKGFRAGARLLMEILRSDK